MNSNKFGAVILGGVLGCIGVAIFLIMVVIPLTMAISMRDWQEVPAKLMDAKVESVQYDSRQSIGSSHYAAAVTYQYEFEGQSYFGDRLDLYILELVNAERAQSLVNAILAESQDGLTIFVNPNAPQDSIYTRTPYWRLLIAMGFFSLLFTQTAVAIFLLAFGKKINERDSLFASPRQKARFTWFAFSSVAAISGMFVSYLVFTSIIQTITSLLMCIPAFYLLNLAWAREQAWRRYANVEININESGSALGQCLHGEFTIDETVSLQDSYQVTLRHLQHHVPQDNRARAFTIERWMTAVTATIANVEHLAGTTKTRLRFDIELPTDQHPSGIEGNDRFFWVVHICNTRAGFVFDREQTVIVKPATSSASAA